MESICSKTASPTVVFIFQVLASENIKLQQKIIIQQGQRYGPISVQLVDLSMNNVVWAVCFKLSQIWNALRESSKTPGRAPVELNFG